MKNIGPEIIELLKHGFCAPRIAELAKKLHQPGTTIHYNIKRLEKEGAIRTYKAVYDYKKIGLGHCTYMLVNVKPEKYGDPDEVASRIAKDSRVESVDICTGDYELLVKLRSKDIDEYYLWAKDAIKRYGFSKIISLTSLKQVKSEFVAAPA